MPTLPDHPADACATLEIYFLEVRARLLEIAATLDRIDRAPNPQVPLNDPRREFITRALGILQSSDKDRAKRIQELYSLP